MKYAQVIPQKIYNQETLQQQLLRWRVLNKKIIFTNGVFDILHEGHIASIAEAAALGDILIIGVNSDSSVQRLKGPSRPINGQDARLLLLASLVITDAVILFEEDTPLNLVKAIRPDVLVKGGDYTIEQIAGAKEVIAGGGTVHLANIIEGISTTAIIEKMKTGKSL
jgi:D-glycero-beta-D-manno-heptose 1-phosphate adenylyltransferase